MSEGGGSADLKTLRIFVSSPGDVAEERALAEGVLRRLGEQYRGSVRLEVVLWEHEPVFAHTGYQQQIVRPSECDLVICILWSKLGTRLPEGFAPASGQSAPTGTEYEIRDALEGHRVAGKPNLLIYRKSLAPQLNMTSAEARERMRQIEELDDFCRKTFYDQHGAIIVAHTSYADPREFERKLVEHVRRWLAVQLGQALPKAPRHRNVLAAGIILVAVTLAYFAADRLWLSRRVTTGQPTVAIPSVISDKSIAVLPFTDMSEKHDQEYFADGMAEEILDQLAKIPGLTVVGRASSFQFKDRNEDLRTIGTRLRVAYVLEGSVRRSADRVRVTAQLINTEDASRRWSNTYDEKTEDVLEIQQAIAVGMSRALQLTLTSETAQDRSMANGDAYDLYLRGLHALDSGSKDGCEQAIELFNQLLHLEPNSERALISLAWAHDCIGWGGWQVPGAGLPQAREVATRTLQVDAQSADAHLVLADVYMELDYDWTSAQREIDTAFKLASPDARALRTAARLAGALGHFDRSLELLTQALALDPLDPELYDQLGDTYARAGKFERAEEMYRHCLQIAPQFVSEHFYVSNALLYQNRLSEALAEADREQEDSARLAGRALVLYALHHQRESDAALREFIKVTGLEWASEVARVYAFRGEREQALTWLDKAYQQRDPDLYFIKGDPLLRNLEGDARYNAFLRKMNLLE